MRIFTSLALCHYAEELKLAEIQEIAAGKDEAKDESWDE